MKAQAAPTLGGRDARPRSAPVTLSPALPLGAAHPVMHMPPLLSAGRGSNSEPLVLPDTATGVEGVLSKHVKTKVQPGEAWGPPTLFGCPRACVCSHM